MSTYDIICQTYDVVRLLEVAVSAVLKEPDSLPTAQADELCLSASKRVIGSNVLKNTRETSLWEYLFSVWPVGHTEAAREE